MFRLCTGPISSTGPRNLACRGKLYMQIEVMPTRARHSTHITWIDRQVRPRWKSPYGLNCSDGRSTWTLHLRAFEACDKGNSGVPTDRTAARGGRSYVRPEARPQPMRPESSDQTIEPMDARRSMSYKAGAAIFGCAPIS
jgi:hypothetical protein